MKAAAAREAAGLTLAQAARRVRVSASYLRRLERANSFPYFLAHRLAWVYGCSLNSFLPALKGEEPGSRCDKPERVSGIARSGRRIG